MLQWKLSEYQNVCRYHFDRILNDAVEEGEIAESVAEELKELAKERFKVRPTPFWHVASMLQTRGYHNLVSKCLKLAN